MSMISVVSPRCSSSGDDVGVEAAEQEAAVALEHRHLDQVVRAVGVEVVRVARALGVLDLEQRAVVAVGPAVERAGQGLAVVPLLAAEHRAAVRAGVDQAVQPAVLVARDHDRLAADVGREVVAGLGDLALVREVDPVALEDVLHLELEDLFVGEDPPVGLHHPGLDGRRSRRRRAPSRRCRRLGRGSASSHPPRRWVRRCSGPGSAASDGAPRRSPTHQACA